MPDLIVKAPPVPPPVSDFRASIEKAVADLVPADKHIAVIMVATMKGPRFATAMRLGDHWKLHAEASLRHGDGQPWSGEVGLMYTR